MALHRSSDGSLTEILLVDSCLEPAIKLRHLVPTHVRADPSHSFQVP